MVSEGKAKKLKSQYDALKKSKQRARTQQAKEEIQKAIDAKVAELNKYGINTRGTPKQPQGGGKESCICSVADLMTKGHRPNCPAR